MKVNSILWSVFFGLVCLLAGCTLRGKDYVQYVQDEANGLHQMTMIKPFVFDLQLEPHTYLLMKEYGLDVRFSTLSGELAKMKNQVFFRLNISADSISKEKDIFKLAASNKQEYDELYQYFSFSFDKDIYIAMPDGAKISASFVHFEQGYSISGQKTFTICFELPELKDTFTLVIHPQPLQTGILKFSFHPDQIVEHSLN